MYRFNLQGLGSNIQNHVYLDHISAYLYSLLLSYLDEISIYEHKNDVMDDVMNAFLSAYTAKANIVSNAYKRLKRVSAN